MREGWRDSQALDVNSCGQYDHKGCDDESDEKINVSVVVIHTIIYHRIRCLSSDFFNFFAPRARIWWWPRWATGSIR